MSQRAISYCGDRTSTWKPPVAPAIFHAPRISRVCTPFHDTFNWRSSKKGAYISWKNEVGDNQARVGWSYRLFWVGNFTYTKLRSPCNDAIIRNLWEPWVCLELSSLNWDGSMNILCVDDTPVRVVGQGIDVQTILLKLSHCPNLIPPPPASPALQSYPVTTAHSLSNAPPRMLRGNAS